MLRVAYDNVVLLALYTMISIVLCSSVFLYYLPVLSIHFLLFVSKFYVVAGWCLYILNLSVSCVFTVFTLCSYFLFTLCLHHLMGCVL